MLQYLKAVRGLLKAGGLYVLQLNGESGAQRLRGVYEEGVAPYFEPANALGYRDATKIPHTMCTLRMFRLSARGKVNAPLPTGGGLEGA